MKARVTAFQVKLSAKAVRALARIQELGGGKNIEDALFKALRVLVSQEKRKRVFQQSQVGRAK